MWHHSCPEGGGPCPLLRGHRCSERPQGDRAHESAQLGVKGPANPQNRESPEVLHLFLPTSGSGHLQGHECAAPAPLGETWWALWCSSVTTAKEADSPGLHPTCRCWISLESIGCSYLTVKESNSVFLKFTRADPVGTWGMFGGIWICITDSLCRTPETNTTL